ncbi:SgcJ/EcaC family oxidoreductase [Streptosporangium carneum]|uniref:SnoaL-like domain-containing protein n=1 Tax=Streptosporangium carneum TaxID=47481 RepID=A0A9W6MEV1_9ACTN|nr:SgcJ/EcaC family oxidoreductase [Streptosporangium carneum]GLK11380.1 hypothetical protein GCM10017600_47870 [Streptosporangium carneum]
MSDEAAALVAQARQWAGNYGRYSNGVEGAVLSVPLRIRAAWESGDADAFADVFVDNGSLLVGDTQLRGREEIRAYMAEGFAGPYRAARVVEEPVEVRLVAADVALAVTDGGILRDGETELAPGQAGRAMYVIVKQGQEWKLISHQTSPIAG